jgi:hypothetical protein
MQREASQDTSEVTSESDSGVRNISCFLPLPAELHAMCQCEANAKMPSPPISIIGFADWKDAIKTYLFNRLLNSLA